MYRQNATLFAINCRRFGYILHHMTYMGFNFMPDAIECHTLHERNQVHDVERKGFMREAQIVAMNMCMRL